MALLRALEASPGDLELADLAARLYRDERTLYETDAASAAAAGAADDRSRPVQEKLLSQADRAQRADALLNAAVQAPENQASAQAYLTRYRYRADYRLPGADADIQQAVQLEPDNQEVLVAAGWEALRAAQGATGRQDAQVLDQQLQLAKKHFQRAIELQPTLADGYIGLGAARLQQGRADEACKVWSDGIAKVTGSRLELHRRLASALIRTNQLKEAQRVIDTDLKPAIDQFIRGQNVPPRVATLFRSQADLLDAEILLAQRRPKEAIFGVPAAPAQAGSDAPAPAQRGAEAVLGVCRDMPTTQQNIGLKIEVLDLMGRAYANMKRFYNAALAYEEVLQYLPGSTQYAQAAMQMWQMAGQPERAAQLYTGLRGRLVDPASPASPTDWLFVAQAEMAQQLQRPADQRDWTAYQHAFDNAAGQLGEPAQWQLQLLAARRTLAEAQTETQAQAQAEVARLLAKAEQLAPDDVLLWGQLTFFYQQIGLPADADRALERYASLAASPVAHQLMKARLLGQRGQYAEAAQQLTDASKQASPQQQEAILREQVRLHAQSGNAVAATAALTELHALAPQDLEVARLLAELAVRTGDRSEAERWEQALREMEGDSGVWWRCARASRLLLDPSSPDGDKQIEVLLNKIQELRPDWTAQLTLRGRPVGSAGKPERGNRSLPAGLPGAELAVSHSTIG